MEVKIAAGYVRVSTADQTEYSPESQIKLIRDYAKREGYIIPDEYIYQDDGISGKSAAKRPAFQLMIATAKQAPPPFDCIFVWKYSRFARNQEESLVYKNLLKKNGVAVKSISEPSSEDNPFSGLIESIISWMDEYYLINLSTEVKRGMKEKAGRGEAMGRPPFGYRVENKILVPDDNADTVRWIFEQYAAGRTMRNIAVDLGNSGITIKSNKPPDVYAISYILRNPAYIGKHRWSTERHAVYRSPNYLPDNENLSDGKQDAIVSNKVWGEVQDRLKGRNTEIKYARQGNPVFMLKGLVRCSECGSTLVYRKERKALQCYKYTRGQCHTTHYISLQNANKAVIEHLESVVKSGSFQFSPKPSPKSRTRRDWGKLISFEEARLKRATSALLDGAFTSQEYKSIKAEIESNIKKLKAGQVAESDSQPQVDIEKYKKHVLEVIKILKSPDVEESEKNQALRSILEKIVYNKAENMLDFYFAI